MSPIYLWLMAEGRWGAWLFLVYKLDDGTTSSPHQKQRSKQHLRLPLYVKLTILYPEIALDYGGAGVVS